MGNSVKGDVPLKLEDGREFTLVLDMEALLSIEDATGKPLPEVMSRAQQGFMSAVAAIAAAAFVRHHPEMTRADVLDILASDHGALEAALVKATEAAMPAKQAKAGNGGGRKPRRGKSSGASGAKQG